MTSRTTVLAVVIFLGFSVLAVILADAVLVALQKPTLPTSIETLAATGMGALAGILASTRSTLGPNESEPTTVQAAVKVEPVDHG